MSDRFLLATANELRPDLENIDRNFKMQKAALNRLVANMTVNNHEMLTLLPQVVKCMHSTDTEVKRMCYLYLETLAKVKPNKSEDVVRHLIDECKNKEINVKTRAIALRSLSSIHSKEVFTTVYDLVGKSMKSTDPYMRKTACNAAVKLWTHNRSQLDLEDLLSKLNHMFVHEKESSVLGAVVQALKTVTDGTPDIQFIIDFKTAKRLAVMLEACPEFSQIAILTAIQNLVPETSEDAATIAELLVPGLRHVNSAVVMGTARVLLMLSHYNAELQFSMPKLVFNALLSQLNRPPEIQYGILRNIYILLLSINESVLEGCDLPLTAFFYHATDLSYIRSTKIDILVQLSTKSNIDTVVKELNIHIQHPEDKASRVKAISALGKLGTRFPDSALDCISLLEGVRTEPQGIISLVQIVRKYNTDKTVLAAVSQLITSVESAPKDPKARQAFVWFLGIYGERNCYSLLEPLVAHIQDEPVDVLLQLFTTTTKLFFRHNLRLVDRALEYGMSHTNPDVQCRAQFYHNIVQMNASSVVNVAIPPTEPRDLLHSTADLEDLELSLGYLSSIFIKPATQLFRVAKQHELQNSPCILPREISRTANQPVPQVNPRIMRRQTTLGEQMETLQLQQQPDDVGERLIDL